MNRAAKEKLAPEFVAQEKALVLLWLGRALFASGKKEQGLAQVKESVALRPDEAEAQRALGELSEALGKTEAAIKAYRRAVELDASYAEGNVALGRLLEATDRPDEAVE